MGDAAQHTNKKQVCYWNKSLKDSDFYLKDRDFYPPQDDRVLTSLIEDIDEEDNFENYAKFIYCLYEKEGYYEN